MEPRLLRPPSPTRYKGSSQPGRSSTGTLQLRYDERARDDFYPQDPRYRPASHDRPFVIPSQMLVRKPVSSHRSPRSSAEYVLASRDPRHSAERIVVVPSRRERSKERDIPEEYYTSSRKSSAGTSTSASRAISSRTPLSLIDTNTSGDTTRYRYGSTSTILEKDEPDAHPPRRSEKYYLSPSGASVQRRTHRYEDDTDHARQYIAARRAQGSRQEAIRRYEHEEPTSRAVRDGYSYTGVGEQAARDLAEPRFRYPEVRERRRSMAMHDEPEYRTRIRESHGPPVSTRGFDRIEHVERGADRELRHTSRGSVDTRREYDSNYLAPPIRREERRRESSLDDSRRAHRRHASLDDRGDLRSHRRSYIEPSTYERDRERDYEDRLREKVRRRDDRERDRDLEDDDAHQRRRRADEKEKEKEDEKRRHRHGAEALAAAGGALGLAAVEGLKKSRRDKDESGSDDEGTRKERRREKEKVRDGDEERPRRNRRNPDETEEERRERRYLRRKQREEEEAQQRDRGTREVHDENDERSRGARDVSRAEDTEDRPRRRRVRRRRHPEEQEEQDTSPSSTSSDEQPRRRHDRDLSTAAAATAGAGAATLALASDRDRDRSYSRTRRPSVVPPPETTESTMPKSILRKPTVRFPELDEETRPGVAPHKDDMEKDHTKRWTQIKAGLVDPRALEEPEVQYYADQSYAIRKEDDRRAEQDGRRRDDRVPLRLTDSAHRSDDSDGEKDRHDDPYRSRPRRSKASTDNTQLPIRNKERERERDENDSNSNSSAGHDDVNVNVKDPYARPRRRRDEATTMSAKKDEAIGDKTYVPPQRDLYEPTAGQVDPPNVPAKVPLVNGHDLNAKVEDEE